MPPIASGSHSIRLVSIDLLPAADQAVRCAEWTKQIGCSPAGTALAVDAVAMIDLPLPWPKPVFDHALLSGWGLASEMELWCGRTRVLARLSQPGERDTPLVSVTLVARSHHAAERFEWQIEPRRVAQLFARLALRPPGPRARAAGAEVAQRGTEIVVCTQGSHDVCCGSEGTRVADELEATSAHRVHRVSHMTGHRFAPTAMTLPDGRMWAGLSAAQLAAIADREMPGTQAAQHCRGWWGLPAGPAQVAELAVFAEVGWELDSFDRAVSVTQTSDDTWAAEVTASTPFAPAAPRTWRAEIERGREVPVIKCRVPGGQVGRQPGGQVGGQAEGLREGQPLKTTPEYRCVSLNEVTPFP